MQVSQIPSNLRLGRRRKIVSNSVGPRWMSSGTMFELWPRSQGVLKMHSFGIHNRPGQDKLMHVDLTTKLCG
jgi:hypothetical protein